MKDTDSNTNEGDGNARQSPPTSQPDNSAAALLGPRLVLAAQDQGYAAGFNGDHVDACPWRNASSDREQALRQMWVRGYAAGRTDLRVVRNPREL